MTFTGRLLFSEPKAYKLCPLELISRRFAAASNFKCKKKKEDGGSQTSNVDKDVLLQVAVFLSTRDNRIKSKEQDIHATSL